MNENDKQIRKNRQNDSVQRKRNQQQERRIVQLQHPRPRPHYGHRKDGDEIETTSPTKDPQQEAENKMHALVYKASHVTIRKASPKVRADEEPVDAGAGAGAGVSEKKQHRHHRHLEKEKPQGIALAPDQATPDPVTDNPAKSAPVQVLFTRQDSSRPRMAIHPSHREFREQGVMIRPQVPHKGHRSHENPIHLELSDRKVRFEQHSHESHALVPLHIERPRGKKRNKRKAQSEILEPKEILVPPDAIKSAGELLLDAQPPRDEKEMVERILDETRHEAHEEKQGRHGETSPSQGSNVGSQGKDKNAEEENERAEYASDPREFTKTGTPLPFWMFEMKKGPDYLMKLHRRYGRKRKHERVPVYKADLEVVSINTNDSFNSVDLLPEQQALELYHPGLKRLIPADRIFLFHRVEITTGIWYCLRNVLNIYHVLNHHGHIMFRIKEKSIKSCGRQTSYTFSDFWDRDIMQIISRNYESLTSVRRKYEVYCPLDESIGYVVQHWRWILSEPAFSILDQNETKLIHFERLPRKLPLFRKKNEDIIFEYQSVRGQGPLGTITKKLANIKMANFTEHDYYGLKVQHDVSPNIKAKIMAAWFVIYKVCYQGKTYRDVHHNLSNAAKRLFADHKPSTEEIPERLDGDIVFQNREQEEANK